MQRNLTQCPELYCKSNVDLHRLGVEEGVVYNKGKSINKLIVSCSGIRKVKRLDKIIEVLANLKSEKIRWIHFGDGELMNEIKQLALDKLGSKGVEFEFKGNVNNESLLNYYANNQVDCFVNLSDSEGVPVSIMEACSYAIPIIATDVGGTKEIVFDSQNGYLIGQNHTLESVAAKLDLILNNPDNSFGINSAKIYKRDFSSKDNFNQFCKTLKNIIKA